VIGINIFYLRKFDGTIVHTTQKLDPNYFLLEIIIGLPSALAALPKHLYVANITYTLYNMIR
jgi:hypothetical protein